MDDAPAIRRIEQQPEGKRRTMMLSEGDRVYGEGSSVRPNETTPTAPKPRRKRGAAGDGEDGEGRRRRKPKATVEVNSTFTELRRLLQEMRPSTLQVLKTPYYRNCKAARNMRKGVRQIRDFCKQVRLETVMLAKKKQGEELTKRRRKPDTSPAPEGAPSKTLDLEAPSPSHSLEQPSLSNEKKAVPVVQHEPSESSEAPKPRLVAPKPDSSPAHREREREITPKTEREITPKREKEREREKSPVRREREREVLRERERSPKRERERDIVREREKSPKKEREREKSPLPVQQKENIEEEEEEMMKDETEESE